MARVYQIIPSELWIAAARLAIQTTIDEAPAYPHDFAGERNYKHQEFTRILRQHAPIPLPGDQSLFTLEFTPEYAAFREAFLDVWYRECADMMGHLLTVPSKAKARTLF